MIELTQKFEFSAAHRLHNPAFTDEQNRQTFGKCSNVHGHGHNYILEVAVSGPADDRGVVMELPVLERVVMQHVIEPFDHRNLNVEVIEFAQLNPTVENIAMVIYRRLKGPLQRGSARLAAVTVWETPKTWCRYSE